MRFHPLLLAASLLFASCTEYSVIHRITPVFRPSRISPSAVSKEEGQFTLAKEAGRRNPLLALDDYLTVARDAGDQLRKNPNDRNAAESYNFAVARVFSVIQQSKLDPWSQPLVVPCESGDYLLDCRKDPRKAWNPGLYEFTPVDELDAEGIYVTGRMRKDGLGAPLVAVGKANNEEARANFTMDKTYYGVTALATFQGRHCTLFLKDPLAEEMVSLDGHTYPLAADFTMPLAVMLAATNPKKMELNRLLHPQDYAETARISRLQPYDPDKTVVLVIHGLKDSPATWAPMINSLRADEKIRKNYQFWFYSYPSGYPYPYSAAILRRELDAVEKKFPLRKPMVVIGHSMGGCISRLLITDTGDKLWNDYFGKPSEKVHLSAESKKLCEEALIFKHRSEVGRVIFIAAPLKGSNLASGWPGRIGSWLIKAPLTIASVGNEAVKAMTTAGDSVSVSTIPNSVDTLSPTNRFVVTINKFPITPGIPYHTIMGDRGKGGNHDRTSPVQSDGIVPYWSSHMDGARSELVVPSGHSAHQNPQAIAEVGRILKESTN